MVEVSWDSKAKLINSIKNVMEPINNRKNKLNSKKILPHNQNQLTQ